MYYAAELQLIPAQLGGMSMSEAGMKQKRPEAVCFRPSILSDGD
jgi:hypothetical protein